MDKKRIEIIITSVLVVIFILVSFSAIKKVKQKLNPKSAPTVFTPAQDFLATDEAMSVSAGAKKEKVADWVRCPFCGKVYSGIGGIVDISNLKLTGIFWDENNPQALISNQIVGEKDKIGSCRVVKIEKDRVILNDGIQNFELKLDR